MKHATVKDEPIADIMGNINSTLTNKLLERQYGGDMSKVPVSEYIGNISLHSTPTKDLGVNVEAVGNQVTYRIGSDVPERSSWLRALAGDSLSWLYALLMSETIVQGTSYIDNPLRRLFAPRKGQSVVVESVNGRPITVSLYGSARSYGEHKSTFKALEVKYSEKDQTISLLLFEERRDVAVPLQLLFVFHPEMAFAPIHEVEEGRNNRIKQFYWKLWFGDDSDLPKLDARAVFKGPDVIIEPSQVEQFCAVVGNQSEAYQGSRVAYVRAPMDFAIVAGWQVCFNIYDDSWLAYIVCSR